MQTGANCSKQSVEKGNHCLPGAKLLERRAGNAHQSAGSRVACQIFWGCRDKRKIKNDHETLQFATILLRILRFDGLKRRLSIKNLVKVSSYLCFGIHPLHSIGSGRHGVFTFPYSYQLWCG